MFSDDYIHTGRWTNWSHNAVFGKTITIPSHGGFFLVAFLTLYVTIAGTRFWLIIAFLIHQEIANRKEYDGMHIQQQAILRNAGAPMTAAISLVKIAYRWRKTAKRPFLRSLPLIVLALLILGAFRAASILTAEVTRAAGNETLIHSSNCSYSAPSSPEVFQQGGFRTQLTVDALAAASYSRACYGADSTTSTQCSTYMTPRINWTEVANPKCPYSSELCFSAPSAVYAMDTGHIDSHLDLGLNARKDDRITYRRLTTCAPINGDKYLKKGSDSSGNTYYNYSLGYSFFDGNWTFTYNDRAILDNIGYQVTALSTDMPKLKWPTEIQNLTGDIVIAFITANSLIYDNPNKDLIFAATKPENRSSGSNEVKSFFVPDNKVSLLGCLDQHQICSPSTSQCSELSGWPGIRTSAAKLNLNSKQNATVTYLWYALRFNNIFYTVGSRGSAALQVSNSVYQTTQETVSDTQWITEVQGWFNASLARLQQSVVDIATGPAQAKLGVRYTQPGIDNKFEADLCSSQIIRSAGQYQNFSVLGIAIILAFSTFFIWLSFMIGTATGWVQRWIHKGEDRRLQWLLDDNLQLQRMAYVGAGEGRWAAADPESIPITQDQTLLKTSLYLPANQQNPNVLEQVETPKQG